jgi:hypothetical protein
MSVTELLQSAEYVVDAQVIARPSSWVTQLGKNC